MACEITFTPVGETEPITLTEAEFVAFLAAGEYDKMVEKGLLDLPPISKDVAEEIRQKNNQADKEGKGISQFLKNVYEKTVSPKGFDELLKEMQETKTIITNKETLKDAAKVLEQYQSDYDSNLSAYDPITRVINDIRSGKNIPTAVGQVLTQMLIKNTALEIKDAIENNNEVKKEALFNTLVELSNVYSKQGTDAGRALQARNMFMQYVFNDPQLAGFFYMQAVEKANEKAKKDLTNTESAGQIKDKVEKTKAKAVKEVAAEVAASINEKLYKEIKTKGIGKNATKEKLKQVDDFFDKIVAKFEGADNKTFSSIIPITPKQMIDFTNAVREVVKAGINLQAAISQVSTDLVRKGKATVRETSAMKANLIGATTDTEKEIKNLTKIATESLIKSDKNTIEEIIQAFYSKPEQLQSDLEKMVVEQLGVSEKEAVGIAEQIKNGIKTKLKQKLLRDLGSVINYEQTIAKAEENKNVATSFINKFLPSLSISKNKANSVVDKLLQLSMMDALTADTILDLMKNKYGIAEFTTEMADFVTKQAIKINQADTQGRKNKEMAKMTNKMAELAPLYYNEAMNSLWFPAVLSGFSTQDANISYNINQVWYSLQRAVVLSLINNIKNKGSFIDKANSFKNDLFLMFMRTLYQDVNTNSLKQVPFSSTVINLAYGIKEGTSSFEESEKMLESQSQSETDYTRYSQKLKPFNQFKYVGRALSAFDKASENLLENPWLIPMLREMYGKEGLDPKAIDAKLKSELVRNLNEIEIAKQKAIDDIIKFDIEVKKVKDKYHVTYNDKVVFIKNTKQEALDLVEDAAKLQTVAIKRFAYERLQSKINDQALRSARHLTRETIMSAPPSSAVSMRLYDKILSWKGELAKIAKETEAQARASNKLTDKYSKGLYARSIYALNRTIPFVKVLINLTEGFLLKDNPFGYLRAARIKSKIANPKTEVEQKLAEFYLSETQINDLKARAIISTLIWGVPLLSSLFGGEDEEDKKEYLNKQSLKNEEDYLKYTSEIEDAYENAIEKDNPYLLIPKDGEVFGSLQFMPYKTRKALENAGLAKEHSYYKGKYPNGKFVSILSDTRKFNVATVTIATSNMLKKYSVNNKYDKRSTKQKKDEAFSIVSQAIVYSLMSFMDYSVTKKSKTLLEQAQQGKVGDAVMNIAEQFAPELSVANPSLLKQAIRYVDGTSRESVSVSENPFLYATSKLPALGSIVSVYGSNKRYGMFGEEMYTVPGLNQGTISQYIYDFRFADKNKAEKNMYMFLASKGYAKIKSMPKDLQIVKSPEEVEVITEDERSMLGMKAGKNVMKTLTENKGMLESLPKPLVTRYVDRLFNLEFKKEWLVYKGIWNEKNVKEAYDSFDAKLEADKEKLEAKNTFIKNNDMTDEEIRLMKISKKPFEDKAIILKPFLKSKNNDSYWLDRLVDIDIIDNDERTKLEEQ